MRERLRGRPRPPRPAPAPAASNTVVVRRQASAAANVATNFQGTRCQEPGIYIDDGRELTLLEPTSISQKQSGSGVLSGLTYGVLSVKSRAAIRGTRAQVRIRDYQPKFLFCFEESQTGLSYQTKGAVNPSEFMLVSLRVNARKRQRSFVIGKFNQWTGSRGGAPPKELRDVDYKRLRAGIYEAKPARDLAPGEYAFYYAGDDQGGGIPGFYAGGGPGGKLFPFGLDVD